MLDGNLVAGVELGGTKSVALLAYDREIVTQTQISTTTPDETLGFLARQLTEWGAQRRIAALGIASFGPIRVNPAAADYGHMLPTPKPGWSAANVAEALAGALDCPWTIDTDVNAAALAEGRWGAAQGLSSVCYLTLGTGVGGGLLVDGRPVHGALHPEIGHLRMRRAQGDAFAGICPFHGDCIEGLVSGPAIHARFGLPGNQVSDDDVRWRFVADDLAELIGAVALMASPEKVLVGGGVGIGRPFLLESIRDGLVDRLGGYLPHITGVSALTFVEPPMLGHDAGPLGAIALGQAALDQNQLRAGT